MSVQPRFASALLRPGQIVGGIPVNGNGVSLFLDGQHVWRCRNGVIDGNACGCFCNGKGRMDGVESWFIISNGRLERKGWPRRTCAGATKDCPDLGNVIAHAQPAHPLRMDVRCRHAANGGRKGVRWPFTRHQRRRAVRGA